MRRLTFALRLRRGNGDTSNTRNGWSPSHLADRERARPRFGDVANQRHTLDTLARSVDQAIKGGFQQSEVLKKTYT